MFVTAGQFPGHGRGLVAVASDFYLMGVVVAPVDGIVGSLNTAEISSGSYSVAYELSGKIKLIQEPRTFDSGFSKREMVVTVEDGRYPQDINLEFVQDKAGLLDNLQPGQEVTVSFDIRGREYNGRYFNNLQGWKVVAAESASAPSDTPSAAPFAGGGDSFEDQDIPF